MAPESVAHSGHGWGLLFSLFLYSNGQMSGSIEMASEMKSETSEVSIGNEVSNVPVDKGVSNVPVDKGVSNVPVDKGVSKGIIEQGYSLPRRDHTTRSPHKQPSIHKPIRQVAERSGEATISQALRGAPHRLDHESPEGTSGVLRTERVRPLSILPLLLIR